MTPRPRGLTLTGHLRACFRLLALVVITAGFTLYAALTTRSLAARCVLFRAWSRVVARLIGVRLRVEGQCPREAALVIGNHASYLDILVLTATAGVDAPIVFVAKADVAGWPIVGSLCRFVGTVFVDRTSKSTLPQTTYAMADLIASGVRVMLFPEGTTTNGTRVLPFRPALLQPAIDRQAPVACVAIAYDTPARSPSASTAVCWWGDMTFGDHFYRLLGLPSIDARIAWSAEAIVERSRRTLAARAHAAVVERFEHLRAPRVLGRRADDQRREAWDVDLLDRQRLEPRGVEHIGKT